MNESTRHNDDSVRGADVIARALARAGCRQAFGIPGGEILTLVDAMTRAGIQFVLVRHENAGGFMAEGTHHVTGAPALLVTTLGPGAANTVNVVANAHQDRVPMIVITACLEDSTTATYTHQIFDHQAVLRPVTKASFRVDQGAVATIIDKALTIALDDRPGPVHLDLPMEAADALVSGESSPRVRPSPVGPLEGPELARARALLQAAQRPLMIAGLEVLGHRADGSILAFAEQLGIPVITTYKAKGVIPEDHPLSLGAAGLSPKADAILLPVVAQSDFILLAGYDPIEMRMGWRDPWPASTPVVELSGVAHSHSMFPVTSLFVGDIGAGLRQLRNGLSARSWWPEDQIQSVRRRLQDAFAPEPEWGPGVIIAAAMDVLPNNVRITVDTGAHRILLSQMWRCSSPRQIIQSTGLCTMGCAVPMAIGLRLADPERPVVAFVGDGGLDMVLGELATARDLAVSITLVVFDDSSLSLIEKKQRRRGLPRQGVDFGKTDYPAVARALGCTGFLATSRDELTHALRASLSRPGVCVISCPIDVGAYDGRI